MTGERIFVTGANGFIGRNLLKYLSGKGFSCIGVVRSKKGKQEIDKICDEVFIWDPDKGEIDLPLDKGDSIIHLAARVHHLNDDKSNSHLYDKVNDDLTRQLGIHARSREVGKFIYTGSIKSVKAEYSRESVVEEDELANPKLIPEDPYGISKRNSDIQLKKIFEDSSQTYCVSIRLPLVYGPEVKGNFLKLLKMASRGKKLPLKGMNALRSFLYVKNFASAVEAVLRDQRVGPKKFEFFYLTDGEDKSSCRLYNDLFRSFHNRDGVYYFPVILISALSKFGSAINFLFGSNLSLNNGVFSRMVKCLRFSTDSFRKRFSWQPPITPEEGIMETVAWFSGKDSWDGSPSN